MKHGRRILSLLLCVVMVLGLFPTTAFAATVTTANKTLAIGEATYVSGAGGAYTLDITTLPQMSDGNIYQTYYISASGGATLKLTNVTGFSYGAKSMNDADVSVALATPYISVQYTGSNATAIEAALESIQFTGNGTITISAAPYAAQVGDIYFGGHYYRPVEIKKTWVEAMNATYAARNNERYTGYRAHPLTITTQEENQVMVNVYKKFNDNGIWLGAVVNGTSSVESTVKSYKIQSDTLEFYGNGNTTLQYNNISWKSSAASVVPSNWCWILDTPEAGQGLPGQTGDGEYWCTVGSGEPNGGGPIYLGYTGAYWDDLQYYDWNSDTDNEKKCYVIEYSPWNGSGWGGDYEAKATKTISNGSVKQKYTLTLPDGFTNMEYVAGSGTTQTVVQGTSITDIKIKPSSGYTFSGVDMSGLNSTLQNSGLTASVNNDVLIISGTPSKTVNLSEIEKLFPPVKQHKVNLGTPPSNKTNVTGNLEQNVADGSAIQDVTIAPSGGYMWTAADVAAVRNQISNKGMTATLENGNIVIGGTPNGDVDLSTGFTWPQPKEIEANVNNTNYNKLSDAIDAANSGETVAMKKNPAKATTGMLKQGATLKDTGNNTYKAAANASIGVDTSGKVTLNSGKLDVSQNGSVAVKGSENESYAVSSTDPKSSFTVTAGDEASVAIASQNGKVSNGKGLTFTAGGANRTFKLDGTDLSGNASGDAVTVTGGTTADQTIKVGTAGTPAGDVSVTVPGENTGDVTVTKGDGTNTMATVSVANEGESFQVGDKTYTAGDNNAQFTIDKDGKVKLSSGKANLKVGDSVYGNVSGLEITNPTVGGLNTVTVESKTGYDQVTVPANGTVEIGGKTYTAGSEGATFIVGQDGTVKLSSGTANLGDRQSVYGSVSGKEIANPADSGEDTVTVKSDSTNGKDIVTIPAGTSNFVTIDDKKYTNDKDNEALVIDVTANGASLSSGSVKPGQGADILMNGTTIQNPEADGGLTICKNGDTGSISLPVGKTFSAKKGGDTNTYKNVGETQAEFDVDAEGNVTLKKGKVQMAREDTVKVSDYNVFGHESFIVDAGDGTGTPTVTIPKKGDSVSNGKGLTFTAGKKNSTFKLDGTDLSENATGDAIGVASGTTAEIKVGSAGTPADDVKVTIPAVNNHGKVTVTKGDGTNAMATVTVAEKGDGFKVGDKTFKAGSANTVFTIDQNGNVKLTSGAASLEDGDSFVGTGSGKTITNPADSGGDRVIVATGEEFDTVTVPANGTVVIDGKPYTNPNGEEDLVLRVAADGTVTVTSGDISLGDNQSVVGSVSGKTITNPAGSGNDQVKVEAKDGYDQVTVPANANGDGSVTIDGKTYYNTSTTDPLVLKVAANGTVTVTGGAASLKDGTSVMGSSGKTITNPSDSGDDIVTVKSDSTNSKDTVTIPAGTSNAVIIAGEKYINADEQKALVIEVTADGASLSSGEVLLEKDQEIKINGNNIANDPAAPAMSISKDEETGAGSIELAGDGAFASTLNGTTTTYTNASGENEAGFKVASDGTLTLARGMVNMEGHSSIQVAGEGNDYTVTSDTAYTVTAGYNGDIASVTIPTKGNCVTVDEHITFTAGKDGSTFQLDYHKLLDQGDKLTIGKDAGDYQVKLGDGVSVTVPAANTNDTTVTMGQPQGFDGKVEMKSGDKFTVDGGDTYQAASDDAVFAVGKSGDVAVATLIQGSAELATGKKLDVKADGWEKSVSVTNPENNANSIRVTAGSPSKAEVKSGDSVTIGGKTYKAEGTDSTFSFDQDGNVTLSAGKTGLAQNQGILGGTSQAEIKNTSDAAVQVEKAADKDIVTVPNGGKVSINGKEYTNAADSGDMTAEIDRDGNVTLTGGMAGLGKDATLGLNGAAITNNGDAAMTMTKNGDGTGTLAMKKDGAFSLGGTTLTAPSKDMSYTIGTDGKLTANLPKGETVTINGVKYTAMDDDGVSLTVDKDGNVAVAGTFTMETDPTAGPTYVLDGKVEQSPNGAAPRLTDGKSVTLTKSGKEAIKPQGLEEVNGEFRFTGIPAGTYNVVVSDRNKTMTKLMSIPEGGSLGTNQVELPTTDTSSILNVTDRAPVGAVAGGLDTIAEENAVNGSSVQVILTVDSDDENTDIADLPEADGKKLVYLDMSLKKVVDGASSSITDGNRVMEIILTMDTNGLSNITVFRKHGTQAAQALTKLDARPTGNYVDGTYYVGDGFVVVYTSKFSPYAIGYNDRNNTGNTITVGATQNGTVSVSPENAVKGMTVTITVNPDQGYKLDSLTVKDKNGNLLTLTKVSETQYTFVKPSGKVTVQAQFGLPTYATCFKDDTCPMDSYTDLNINEWYHDGVHYCLDNEMEIPLMIGYGDGTWGPSDVAFRNQIVMILWRLNQCHTVNYNMTFEDVPAGEWYTEAIRWAASEDIVIGYDDDRKTFGPTDAVTREQMVTILYRYAQKMGYDVTNQGNTSLASFADAESVSDYALPAMEWACSSGLIIGMEMDGELCLNPQGNTTRAEMATMMMRFCVEIER